MTMNFEKKNALNKWVDASVKAVELESGETFRRNTAKLTQPSPDMAASLHRDTAHEKVVNKMTKFRYPTRLVADSLEEWRSLFGS